MTAAPAITREVAGAALEDAITLTKAEAEVIEHGKAVLSRTWADDFPWPRRASLNICITWLRESLEDHDALITGRLHPASVFPDLDSGDGAMAEALERVTEDVGMNAGAVILTVREACGDEAAAFVSGTEGEQ